MAVSGGVEGRRSPWRREREASLLPPWPTMIVHRYTYLFRASFHAVRQLVMFPLFSLPLFCCWLPFGPPSLRFAPPVLFFPPPFPTCSWRAVLRALASACRATLPPPTAAVSQLSRCRQRLARNCLRQLEPFPFCIYPVSRSSLALPSLSLSCTLLSVFVYVVFLPSAPAARCRSPRISCCGLLATPVPALASLAREGLLVQTYCQRGAR